MSASLHRATYSAYSLVPWHRVPRSRRYMVHIGSRAVSQSRSFGRDFMLAICNASSLVGSRNGAWLRRFDLSVAPRFLWECLTNRTVSWFPSPATSNGACRFPALRSPARFTRRFMGRSQLAVLSILIAHQHLLHTIQPFPSSSSCISSVSGLADCRAFLSGAPASHHCQRNCETAGSLRSLGVTPVHRYC